MTSRRGRRSGIPLTPHRYWADEREPWSLLWLHFAGSDVTRYPVDGTEVVNLGPPKDQEEVKALFSMLFGTLEGAHTRGNLVHAATLTEAILSAIFSKEKGNGWESGNSVFTKAIRICTTALPDRTERLCFLRWSRRAISIPCSIDIPLFTDGVFLAEDPGSVSSAQMTDLQVQRPQRCSDTEVGYFSRRFQRVKKGRIYQLPQGSPRG